jgi:branched-chain amino acid transport system substrate-binding protein
MRKLIVVMLGALLIFGALIAQDTFKIAFIDPLSGGGAGFGERGLKCFRFPSQ